MLLEHAHASFTPLSSSLFSSDETRAGVLSRCSPGSHLEEWLEALQEDGKPRKQQLRAARKVIQVLVHLGSFLQARGRAEEALGPLQRAQKLGIWLAPPSASAHSASDTSRPAPSDLALRARSESANARALCAVGGSEGKRFQEAKRLFGAALTTTAEAQAGAGRNSAAFADLVTEVSTDLAQCLHQEGDLDHALEAVQQALEVSLRQIWTKF